MVYMAMSHSTSSNRSADHVSTVTAARTAEPPVITQTPAEKMFLLFFGFPRANLNTPSTIPMEITGNSRFAPCIIKSAVP